MCKPVLILLSLFLFTTTSYADVYLWEDENEKVHTTNNIENVPEEYKDMVEVYKEGEEGPLDETLDGNYQTASSDEDGDTTKVESDAKVAEKFRNLSPEDQIKSMQGSYNIGSALDALKAKMKAQNQK